MSEIQKTTLEPNFAKTQNPSNEINIRRDTDELVIGMVGAIGSGVSTVADKLVQLLRDNFGYDASIITLSDFIRKEMDDKNLIGAKRIKNFRRAGQICDGAMEMISLL